MKEFERMCKQLAVSRAAYYKWLHRKTYEQEMENIKLAALIKEYDERFSHILSKNVMAHKAPKYGAKVPTFFTAFTGTYAMRQLITDMPG